MAIYKEAKTRRAVAIYKVAKTQGAIEEEEEGRKKKVHAGAEDGGVARQGQNMDQRRERRLSGIFHQESLRRAEKNPSYLSPVRNYRRLSGA